jgi:calcineurin-like phosphoesterase family protein
VVNLPQQVTSEISTDRQPEEDQKFPAGFCEGKDGVLMIQRGDSESAVGTLFFMYIVNHLIFADQNNLLPWVHLDPAFPCYDASVHGNNVKSFTMLSGIRETQIYGDNDLTCMYWRRKQHYPGPVTISDKLTPQNFTIKGNGLWESYFEPMGGYPPDDPSCRDKPLLQLNKRSVFPGMHVCAPWGVRPWAVPHTPVGLKPLGQNISYHQWLTPMRQRGSEKVRKYFRPLPWLQDLIEKANPAKTRCLSIHARLTDKGNGRKKPPLERFQQYAEAYVNASNGGSIYIATDDGTIFDRIRATWTIADLHYQQGVIRSSGNAAIFRTFQNETHRTNTEGIVDMYSMSKCDFFVHGFSAMAEAAVFINPGLHNRSVNVDAEKIHLISVEQFRRLVSDYYDTKL